MITPFGILLRLLGPILGGASFAVLTWKGFHLELGPMTTSFLQAVQGTFHFAFDFLFEFIEPLLIILGERLAFLLQLKLEPHWQQLVTLAWLYIGADAKNAFGGPWRGATRTGVYRLLFGIPTALAGAMVSGTYPLETMLVVVPLVGAFALYRVWYALRYAFERRSEGQDYRRDLAEKLAIALIIALAGGIVVLAGAWVQTIIAAPAKPFVPFATLYVLIALFIAYHLREGWKNAERTQRADETRRQSFARQGNTKLSRAMIESILVSLLPLAIGAAGV